MLISEPGEGLVLMGRAGMGEIDTDTRIDLTEEQETLAAKIHREAMVIDGTALAYTLEPPFTDRLIETGMSAVVVTVFIGVETGIGSHTEAGQRAIDRTLRLVRQDESRMHLVLEVEDFHRARDAGKLGVVMAFQNATPFGDDLGLVDSFRALGIRCVQITYNQRNLAADGCLEPEGGGLSLYGIELLHALQDAGIAVDLSHVGDNSVDHAIRVAQRPLAFTHCNARKLCDNTRNKTDDQILALTRGGGVIGLNAFPAFLRSDGSRPHIQDLLDQADYLVGLAGVKAVSLGLDFIEGWTDVEKVNLRRHAQAFGTSYDFPVGLEGVSQLPNLTRGLLSRGHDAETIRGILGENLLEYFRRVWK